LLLTGAMSNLRARRANNTAGFTLLEIAVTLAIGLVIAGVALPYMNRTWGQMRLSGAARSISNGVQVAKLRSAAKFTRARLYVDVAGSTFHLEVLDTSVTPNHWTLDGGTTYLPPDVTVSSGPVTTPPLNTQAAIGLAASCKDDNAVVIGGTSCILFNSRGIPVLDEQALGFPPTDADAIYLTNGTEVYAITVLATGFIGTWHTPSAATPAWLIS
jgi:prepilin-type N-terminal cleavage/methylation domain-containing protein